MPDDEAPKPPSYIKMPTAEYNLQEQRDASAERLKMATLHATEKKDLTASFERTLRSKNYIVYALLLANVVQLSLLLGQSMDFSGYGVTVSTGDEAELVEEE